MRAVCCLIPVVLFAQPPAGSISGTVTDSVTNAPVRKASVMLRSLKQANVYTAVTDDTGGFRVEKVDPDTYTIERADGPGYLFERHGEFNRATAAIAVAAEQRVSGLKVQLVPTGALSGRVLDADGEPLPHANVELLRHDPMSGSMGSVKAATTDDRGEYRIFHVKPGRYFLRASSPLEGRMPAENTHRSSRELGYPATYYPDGTQVSQASALAIAAGSDVGGIDFRLRKVPLFHIRGTVAGVPGQDARELVSVTPCGGIGCPPTMMALAVEGVLLFSLDASSAMDDSAHNFDAGFAAHRLSGGRFDTGGLPPGTYQLTYGPARVKVTIGERNVEGVTFTPPVTSDLTVTSLTEGQSAQQPGFEVSLRGVGDAAGKMVQGGRDDTGFHLRGAEPGTYQVVVQIMQPDLYLKSIAYGAGDVSDGLVTVTAEKTALNLVFAKDAGSLSGVIRRENGEPAAGLPVTVAPEERYSNRSDLLHAAITDQNGHFEVGSLAPGSYQVFVWDDSEMMLANLPEFRKAFANQAASATVHAGGHETVQAKIIAAEEIQRVKSSFQ